jgi:hypothetical protein
VPEFFYNLISAPPDALKIVLVGIFQQGKDDAFNEKNPVGRVFSSRWICSINRTKQCRL